MRAVIFDIDGALFHSNEIDATAGWSASARIKLESSRFPVEGIPLASRNDHMDKEAIMVHALKQLIAPFETITYYGGGERDNSAAGALGWNFVAVGEKLDGLRNFSYP